MVQGYTDEAREVLKTLEAENKLPKQVLGMNGQVCSGGVSLFVFIHACTMHNVVINFGGDKSGLKAPVSQSV